MSIDFLATVPIFADLNESDLLRVDQMSSKKDYPKGSMIILEEEYGDKRYNKNYKS